MDDKKGLSQVALAIVVVGLAAAGIGTYVFKDQFMNSTVKPLPDLSSTILIFLSYDNNAPLSASIWFYPYTHNRGQGNAGNFSNNFSVSNISVVYPVRYLEPSWTESGDPIMWSTWTD